MSIASVIFDMDGLLLDTERLERDACLEEADVRGLTAIDEEFFLRLLGRNEMDARRIFLEVLGTSFPYDSFCNAWRERRDGMIAQAGFPIKPGAKDLIAALRARDARIGLATSTDRR